jgi:UDPglucose--hexose-1-phosphate uridylyltransferase
VQAFELPGFPGVQAGVVKWPLTVLRLEGEDRAQLVDAADHILQAWRVYSDPTVGVLAVTPAEVPAAGADAPIASTAQVSASAATLDGPQTPSQAPAQGVPHNTITPMLRKEGARYQFDLALRCNITSAEHPLGVFHPHERLHHIKRENIGLIEVMGLAILPPRVRDTMAERGLSRDDVGRLFGEVLECAGVYKRSPEGQEAFLRFVDSVR